MGSSDVVPRAGSQSLQRTPGSNRCPWQEEHVVQEWVFDSEGARTPRLAEPAVSRDTTAPQPPTAPAGRRARPTRSRLGRRGRWVVAGGAALLVAGTGTALALDPAPAASPSASTTTADGGSQRRFAPREAPDDSPIDEAPTDQPQSSSWAALHQEREVTQPDGSTATVTVQGGEVTAVDDASVTVESSDGFTQTYAVTSSTQVAMSDGALSGLAVGDAVLVEGVLDGETVTATSLRQALAGSGRESGAEVAPAAPAGSQDASEFTA